MRKFGYPLAAITVCVAALSSCQNYLLDDAIAENRVPLTRHVSLPADVQEEQTRAAYDTDGAFIWSATDAISVFDGSNFYKLDLTGGNGTRFAIFSGMIGENDPQFALYPYNSGHNLTSKGYLKFNFPSVYDNYVCGESNTPMYATITSIDGGASFTHLGATIRIKLSGVPAGVKKVTVSTDVNLSGESSLTIADGAASLDVPDGGRAVTYTLENATSDNDNLVFDVPVLAGTYKMFSVDARDANGAILKTFNFIKETVVERAHIKTYNINYATSTSGTTYVDNGIPQLVLQTPGKVGITSKEEYVEGSMVSLKAVDGETEFTSEMKIKGRGNSTWAAPKKPYKFKFNDKLSVLGMPKDKEWVLLADYYDGSLLRNSLTFYMANQYCDFDYVPRFEHVVLYLNGAFRGCYQLGEQVKISKDRVNVDGDGYLLEIDSRAETTDITFNTTHINRPINIKDPDVDLNSNEYNYIKDYVQKAEDVLYSDDFLDPDKGYQSVLDVNSFVDWYIIEEISKNRDSNTSIMGTSMYMHVARDGKISMGPLWDFDLAYGNSGFWESDVYTNFWIKDSFWYERLFADPLFVIKVKARFDEIYSHKQDILKYIDDNSLELREAALNDIMEWKNIHNLEDAADKYNHSISGLRQWLNNRLDWLKAEFDNM